MKELYEKIHEEVGLVSSRVAQKWQDTADADEIEQELWLWILERPGTQQFFRTAQPAQIYSALQSRAMNISSKARTAYEHFSGQYVYTPAEVRDLLDTYWSTDVHNVSSEVLAMAEENISSTMIENILGGTISAEEKVDLELALSDLEEEHSDYYEEIRSYYYEEIPNKDGASHKRKERAVDKLTTIMNRKRSQRETDRVEGLGTKPKNTTIQEDI